MKYTLTDQEITDAVCQFVAISKEHRSPGQNFKARLKWSFTIGRKDGVLEVEKMTVEVEVQP